MPRVCLKRIRIGEELFEGDIFLLPDGRFIYIFPDWMKDLYKDLKEHGFQFEYNPKRGSHVQSCFTTDVTQKALEKKILAIVEAANDMASKESLVIFYSLKFEIRDDSENKKLKESDYKTGWGGTSSVIDLDWQIVRQCKYSETNIIYKMQKYDNRIESPSRKSVNIIEHTPELEAFFKAFDIGLEMMIEKLLAINDADALPELIKKMGPAQLMGPQSYVIHDQNKGR